MGNIESQSENSGEGSCLHPSEAGKRKCEQGVVLTNIQNFKIIEVFQIEPWPLKLEDTFHMQLCIFVHIGVALT